MRKAPLIFLGGIVCLVVVLLGVVIATSRVTSASSVSAQVATITPSSSELAPIPTGDSTTQSVKITVPANIATTPRIGQTPSGVSAITPHFNLSAKMVGGTATFNENDVRTYISNHQMLNMFESVTPVSIAKVDFISYNDLANWFNTTSNNTFRAVRRADQASICLVELSGTFIPLGSPSTGDSTVPANYTPKTYKHGFILFDGATGNFLGNGAF